MKTCFQTRFPFAALALAGVVAATPALAIETASYSVETEIKLLSDQRNVGISDSAGKPGAQLTVQVGHESGLIGLAQLTTISKKSYPDGPGAVLLLAGGWRSGDPDAFHYGVGMATEYFSGAKFSAPHGFADDGTPDWRTTKYDTSYALLELGYGNLDARLLNVISKNFRGANTGSICGTMLGAITDPTAGMNCYAHGDKNSRGSWLLDVGYKYRLTSTTTLNARLGRQLVKNFSEANVTSYSLGVTTKQWGYEWSADAVIPRTKVHELFANPDGKKALDKSGLVLAVSRKF